MKKPTFRIVGKQIFENSDELEEGYVEIEVEAYDTLREIDSDDVADYARWRLDMRHEDDFESNIDDFTDEELVEALQDNYYNFAKLLDEDDLIDYLQDKGYIISEEKQNVLDHIDTPMFEEISQKFLNSSWTQREEMYNLIKNL